MAVDSVWLSHHRDHQSDRCVECAGYLVCRRCLALYPLLVVIGAGFAIVGPLASPWMEALIWLAPIPATIDYARLGLGVTSYEAGRVVWLTGLAAVGLGAALSYHLVAPFDLRFTVPALVFASVWLVAALVGARRADRR